MAGDDPAGRQEVTAPAAELAAFHAAEAGYWRSRSETLQAKAAAAVAALGGPGAGLYGVLGCAAEPPEPPPGTRFVDQDGGTQWYRQGQVWFCGHPDDIESDGACPNCPCTWAEVWDRELRPSSHVPLTRVLPGLVDPEPGAFGTQVSEVRQVLASTGHPVSADLSADVDRAIDRERNQAQDFLERLAAAASADWKDGNANPVWPRDSDTVLRVVRSLREPAAQAVEDRGELLALLSELLDNFHDSPMVREGYQAAVATRGHLEKLRARRASIFKTAFNSEEPPF